MIVLASMGKTLSFVKKFKKSFAFGFILAAGAGFLAFRGEGEVASYTVARGDIEQTLDLSGKAQSSLQADLGFATTGRISKILVNNNQRVSEGQILAQLEIGDLLADLKILEAAAAQEDVKVENAYRKLLSEGLVLTARSNTYEVAPPTVSGAYGGGEGQYKITIVREGANQNFFIKASGLERTVSAFNENSPTPFGTQGLFISFPDNNPVSYSNTTWYLEIPNTYSANYLDNYNAYVNAQKNRDLVTDTAEIDKINAEIKKNTIYAPFSGTVTNIEREVGESAGVGERVVSILGAGKLEIVLEVSELDVAKLIPGTKIGINIDAIPDETFTGTLQTINSRDTEIQGVPVYEAFVELALDPRIKTGMSADGHVILGQREDVLTIPLYTITREGDRNTVEILLSDGTREEREIQLGLSGSDSMVEIVAGLAEGEVIVFPANE